MPRTEDQPVPSCSVSNDDKPMAKSIPSTSTTTCLSTADSSVATSQDEQMRKGKCSNKVNR